MGSILNVMKRFFLLLPFVFLLEGCFFGTFQTAESLKPGDVNAGWYANMPLYFDNSVKEKSKEHNKGAFIYPNIGGYLMYGASKSVDFGMRGSLGEGLGPFTKIQFLNEKNLFLSGAIIAGMAYHPVAQGISLRADLIFSKRLSLYSSLYWGWTIMRAPDYRMLAYKDVKLNDIKEFREFNAIFLGVDLKRKKGSSYFNKIPFGLTMEFTVPLTDYPAIFWGFQFTR